MKTIAYVLFVSVCIATVIFGYGIAEGVITQNVLQVKYELLLFGLSFAALICIGLLPVPQSNTDYHIHETGSILFVTALGLTIPTVTTGALSTLLLTYSLLMVNISMDSNPYIALLFGCISPGVALLGAYTVRAKRLLPTRSWFWRMVIALIIAVSIFGSAYSMYQIFSM